MIKHIVFISLLVITSVANAISNECYSAIKSKLLSTPPDNTAEKCIENLYDEISNGDAAAIHDGVSLLKFTDAGYTFSMKISLAYALPLKPYVVLNELKTDMDTLQWVCGIPFVEPKEPFVKSYYEKTHASLILLTHRTDKETDRLARICLGELDRVYKL